MEVIAKCAFGMTIDRLGENDDLFMKKAREVMNPKISKSPFILISCKYFILYIYSRIQLNNKAL